MREVKLVKKLYEFDELYEDIKDEVIDEHRYINTDDGWYEYIIEEFAEDINTKYGIEFGENIEFNLDYGGYVKLNDVSIDVANFLDGLLADKVINKKLHNKLINQAGEFEIEVECYKYSVQVTFTDYSEVDIDELYITDYLEREVDLEGWFKDNIIKELFNILKGAYEVLISDEYIADTFEANDYEFTVDGKIFNEYEYEVEEKYIMKEKENERNQ